MAELERRLRSRSKDSDEKIAQRLEIAVEEAKMAETPGCHDKTLVNDDLEETFAELERYIFAGGEEGVAAAEGDVAMGEAGDGDASEA